MLTGGYNDKRTEVIDLIDGTKSCTNLGEFPADDPFSLNKGGVVNGQPIVCAGKTEGILIDKGILLSSIQ